MYISFFLWGREVVRRLLSRVPRHRLTLDELIAHAWTKSAELGETRLAETANKLKRTHAKRRAARVSRVRIYFLSPRLLSQVDVQNKVWIFWYTNLLSPNLVLLQKHFFFLHHLKRDYFLKRLLCENILLLFPFFCVNFFSPLGNYHHKKLWVTLATQVLAFFA